jgi:hypothetical protein
MGIHIDFENMAKKIQDYARMTGSAGDPARPANTKQKKGTGGITEPGGPGKQAIAGMVLQLESVCLQACTELETELTNIKKTTQ